jgi:hypothetical protein
MTWEESGKFRQLISKEFEMDTLKLCVFSLMNYLLIKLIRLNYVK